MAREISSLPGMGWMTRCGTFFVYVGEGSGGSDRCANTGTLECVVIPKVPMALSLYD